MILRKQKINKLIKGDVNTCSLCGGGDLEEQKIGAYPYFVCLDCGLEFVPTMGHEPEYLKEYLVHHSDEEELDQLRQIQYQIDSDHLLFFINRGRILDVGCSRGNFTKVLLEKGDFDQITGLDVDTSALKTAKSNISDARVKFIETDFVHYNNEQSFDAIIFRGVFQYLGVDLMEALEKIKENLKPGGFLFLYSLPHSKSFLFKIKKEKWKLFVPEEHKLFFNRESLKYLAQKYGFEIRELVFPYLETAYAEIEKDYKEVIQIITEPEESEDFDPPFFGNIICAVLQVSE